MGRGFDFDPSRSNFNRLRKCRRRKDKDSRCGYSECISARSIPPACMVPAELFRLEYQARVGPNISTGPVSTWEEEARAMLPVWPQ
jgi:hypothetical protein